MWMFTLLFSTPVLAQTPAETALFAQRDAYHASADKLARKACRGEPRACRGELATQIRALLTNPDAFEAEEALLLRVENETLPSKLAEFLFQSDFREAQWVAQEVCLGEAAEAARRDAQSIAESICGTETRCLEWIPPFVERLSLEGASDPDPFHNELDSLESTTPRSGRRAVERLRSLVDQTACSQG